LTEAEVQTVIVKLNLIAGLDAEDQTYAPFAEVIQAKLLGRPDDRTARTGRRRPPASYGLQMDTDQKIFQVYSDVERSLSIV
jgi:hypothetical protein